MLTAQARSHRADLSALALLAERDLRVLFGEAGSPTSVREALRDVLPRLVALYGSAAAALAADWYDDLRDAAAARGRFTAIPAELPDTGRTDALARWSVGPLFAATPDFATALSKAAGGLQRIVANADRDTIRLSSVQDPAARGWARAGVGDCEFCRMLIGRGFIYTEATADFDSHDRCGCVAVPEF